jgi:hypothetical protein
MGLCLDRECDANKPCGGGRACVQGLCIPQGAASTAQITPEEIDAHLRFLS